MAGSPLLSSNLGYDPFTPFLRSKRAGSGKTIEQENTGFSDDGLSYEVARDFPKIAAQALAAYEAAIGHERQKGLNIDSRGIVTSTPVDAGIQDRIYRETIEPTAQFMGIGGNSNFRPGSNITTYKTKAGGVVAVDKNNNTFRQIVPDPETPEKIPGLNQRQKSDLLLIQDDIRRQKTALGKATKLDDKLAIENNLLSLEKSRRKLFDPISISKTNAGPTVATIPLSLTNATVNTLPAYTANWPQQGSFIGNPGGENFFTNSASRTAQTNNPLKVLSVRYK